MSGVVAPVRCDRCGRPVDVTRAALAAGLNHPACVVPDRINALTASAGLGGVDAFVLARWAARIAHSAAQRRMRADAPQARQVVTAAAPLTLPRRPRPIPAEIQHADRLLRIIERVGVGSSTHAPQREAQEVIGREATARAWSTLIAHGAFRVSPPLRLSSPIITGVYSHRWEDARRDLIDRARKAKP